MTGKSKNDEGIVVPSMIYGSETWNMSASDRVRLEVVEMKCYEAYVD